MSAFTTIECKDREEWLAKRREGIGASDAAAILGVSPWKGPADVWGEKVGLVEAPDEETEAMKWGLRLEPAIREAYMEETGRLVVQPGGPFTIVRSTKYPFLQATLDGEIVPIDDRGPGVFESKTAAFFKKEEWTEEPPLQYQIQNQHQLVVVGWAWGGDAVLIGGQMFRHTDFAANANFQKLLVERLEAFWALVTKGTPPPVDGSVSAKDLLAKLFPKETTGKVIELPATFLPLHQELVEIKEQAKKVKAREQELKNLFAAELKDAEMGVLPSGDAYTYKAVHKEPYAVAAQDYRELRFKAKKEKR